MVVDMEYKSSEEIVHRIWNIGTLIGSVWRYVMSYGRGMLICAAYKR